MATCFGPYGQIVTLRGLALKGPLRDEDLEIIRDGAILVENGMIIQVGPFKDLRRQAREIHTPDHPERSVVIPGLVDSHTHLVFAGHRAEDYAQRLSGKTYQQIAQGGGGIWHTVELTRQASAEELYQQSKVRLDQAFRQGVTTIEIKSGYGLNTNEELKMLEVIQRLKTEHSVDIIPTCLAAHVPDKTYRDNPQDYLVDILHHLLPEVKKSQLAQRVDIFVEDQAFSVEQSRNYLIAAQKMGFDLTVHADQFTSGGSALAVELAARSADHLEASTTEDINRLAKSAVVATVLPGATLGLGMPFPPARKLLDAGCCVAIASDWNPGSAPRGDLLTAATLMGAAEKLTIAETLAGMTLRAAQALNLSDRGRLAAHQIADWLEFPVLDYREIMYHQGALKPNQIIKKGVKYHV